MHRAADPNHGTNCNKSAQMLMKRLNNKVEETSDGQRADESIKTALLTGCADAAARSTPRGQGLSRGRLQRCVLNPELQLLT